VRRPSTRAAGLRRALLLAAPWTLFACTSSAPTEAVADADAGGLPNIVLIYADDLGYGDLSCYGATKLSTPNIDRLASQGRRFLDAHSASGVCSPSRYGLLTGTYPLRRNLWGPVPSNSALMIDPAQPTLASVLKAGGYATTCIGKWHLGFGEPSTDPDAIVWNGELRPGPLELGFDSYFGVPLVNSGPPFVYVEDHRVVNYDPEDPFVYGGRAATQAWPAKGGYTLYSGAEAAHRTYVDTEIASVFARRAGRWLRDTHAAAPEQPFFLYLAPTNIHHPFTPAPRFDGSSECGRYGDFVHELDWLVGEVLGVLDELELEEETIVVFTSDNGGMLNNGGQDAWDMGHRLNGELLGFKFGAWEGGHRVPCIVRWPGVVPAGSVSNELISQVDLLATFASVSGRPESIGPGTDSVDLLPALLAPTNSPSLGLRPHLIAAANNPTHLVLRRGPWAYIPSQGEGGFSGRVPGDHSLGGAAALEFTGQYTSDVEAGRIRADAPPGQLYNLHDDPRQTTNLFLELPELARELHAELIPYYEALPDTPFVGWIDWARR